MLELKQEMWLKYIVLYCIQALERVEPENLDTKCPRLVMNATLVWSMTWDFKPVTVFLQAIGKPHSLWCAFAKFYEKHGDIVNARVIFDKATEVNYFLHCNLYHNSWPCSY